MICPNCDQKLNDDEQLVIIPTDRTYSVVHYKLNQYDPTGGSDSTVCETVTGYTGLRFRHPDTENGL